MHIDWRWIKQRPQFIAEELSKKHDVLVLYVHKGKMRTIEGEKYGSIKKIPLFHIPKSYQIFLLYLVRKIYFKFFIKTVIFFFKPSVIWITHPELFDYLDNIELPIVYDCMDNASSLSLSNRHKTKVEQLEKRLLKISSIVFVSSQCLFNIMKVRCSDTDKLVLVRNAFDGKIMDNDIEIVSNSKVVHKILYFGTIANWFDFGILSRSLDKFTNIEYHIIGPIERIDKSTIDKRIIIHSQLEHSKLMLVAKDYDILIMPFLLNETVKSVDPVKFYEYINLDKPIISVYYPEIKRFSRFIEFYKTYDEFCKILGNILINKLGKKYDDSERLDFLLQNTWSKRIELIETSFSKLSHKAV
jgi:hypothetical protein